MKSHNMSFKPECIKIAVIGLGYVGLPLCLEFGKKYSTIGFDISSNRIKELQNRYDKTLQCKEEDFIKSKNVFFTNNVDAIKDCKVFIVSVPTPIDLNKKPDISSIRQACQMIGKILKKNDIVIFESTTYPTCTKKDCVPILQKESGLVFNQDFFVGYSPERINPADRIHTLTKIKKITSGSTPKIAQYIDYLYSSIIEAGTFLVSSIEIAEATKALENAQRDVNIAFINEMYVLFDKLGINMSEVLQAAKTKWNFLDFYPGLVGGHCISIDPYYLLHIAEKIGHYPKIIAAGRIINDMMPNFFAQKLIKKMIQANIEILHSKVLIVGITFKSNCPDIRNSKVPEVLKELEKFGCNVYVYDPLADKDEVQELYGVCLVDYKDLKQYHGILIVLRHECFKNIDFSLKLKKKGVILEINA